MDQHTATAATPSISAIVFLWADTFAEAVPPGKRGIQSYSTGAVVDTKALAQMMFAVTFAELAVNGAIRLEPYTKKSLGLFTSRGINVHVQGPIASPGALEQRIATSKKANEQGESVGDIVASQVKRSREPNSAVVQGALNEALHFGYLHSEGAGGLKGLIGSATITPVTAHIESTRERAAALGAAWVAFRTQNPELATSLRVAISKAIEMRATKDDDPNDF